MEQDFIHRIQELIEREGGQQALSRKTGMSIGAIQRYLKGGEPTRTALMKLAETCSIPIEWLIYGDIHKFTPGDILFITDANDDVCVTQFESEDGEYLYCEGRDPIPRSDIMHLERIVRLELK